MHSYIYACIYMYTTLPYVRLCGLKACQLNGRVGELYQDLESNGRVGILLHGEKKPIALKPDNLMSYHFQTDDMCRSCGDWLKLCAFPPCNCDVVTKLVDPEGTQAATCILPKFAAPSGDIIGKSNLTSQTTTSSSSEGALTRP